MGRFVYSMNVSLDLRIEQVPGDNGAGEWLRIDEELHREFNAQTRALALIVHGRVFYEIMEEYWPRAREDASLPDYMREYGEIWTAKPKVLVSRTRRSADHNTRIIGGDDAIEQLAALRAETDGTIGVGGAALATQLLRAGLLDELLLCDPPGDPRLRQAAVRRLRHADRPRPARAAIVRVGRHDAPLRHPGRKGGELDAEAGRGGCAGPRERVHARATPSSCRARPACCSSTPGCTGDEMACLANDLRESGQPVVAGFSTHPHWDHLLWHPELGDAPRYGTARCAASIRELGCRTRTGRPTSPRSCRRRSPTTYRWTCSASSPACPPRRRRFRGTAPRSGSSSIKRTPRAMRRC